jgi:hypothetical protein
VDANGSRYTIKGANFMAGRFAGGGTQAYGLDNYNNAQRDLDNFKAQGGNTIRILTSYNEYNSGVLGTAEYLRELDQVIIWATQRGIVVDLGQGWAGAQANVVAMDSMLAGRYKNNPLVWINPDNEPNCNSGDTSKCNDWNYWQMTQKQNVQAIRAAGFTNPIVVDGTGWSWDLSQIGSHPLGDGNLIYAAHRYGGGQIVWDGNQSYAADVAFGNLAATYPVFIEELGYDTGNTLSPITWCASFLDLYGVNWVLNRQGSGVMGWIYGWYTDSMTNRADGSWTLWGLIMIQHFYIKV